MCQVENEKDTSKYLNGQQDATQTGELRLILGSQWWREPTWASCPLTPAHTSKQMQTKKKQLSMSYSHKQELQILGKLILCLIKIKCRCIWQMFNEMIYRHLF